MTAHLQKGIIHWIMCCWILHAGLFIINFMPSSVLWSLFLWKIGFVINKVLGEFLACNSRSWNRPVRERKRRKSAEWKTLLHFLPICNRPWWSDVNRRSISCTFSWEMFLNKRIKMKILLLRDSRHCRSQIFIILYFSVAGKNSRPFAFSSVPHSTVSGGKFDSHSNTHKHDTLTM